MRRHFFACSILTLFVSTFSAPVFAESGVWDASMESLNDWHLSGQNLFRYNNYHTNGYDPSSLYPFESNQTYNETRFMMDRTFSPYEYVSLSSSALTNWSRIRSSEQGFVFEDIRSTWEKGDGAIPFRLYAGDYTSNLSYRTIQQNIKGAQLEIQPEIRIGAAEQRHSILGFFGLQQQDYRDVDFNRNIYSGASWLVDMAKYGTWAVHYINNFREKDVSQGFLGSRSQGTWGATFEKVFQLFGQKIGVEAETNLFQGDYDTFLNPNGFENDRSDMSTFLQLTGENGTLFDYGFRYEEYGNHFRPAGGIITPDRRTLSWKLGGKVYQDIRLDGRVEAYRDSVESDLPTDTGLGGITISGPIQNPFLNDLSGYFDIFRESIDGKDRHINTQSWSYIGQLTSTFYEKWNGRFGYNIRHANDDAFDYMTIGREFTADIGHPITLGEASGDARLGMAYRVNSGINSGVNLGPTFALSLAKDPHSLYFNGQYLMDNDRSIFDQDLETFGFGGGYTYNSGPHRISLDCEMNDRNPFELVKNTEDYRIGFTYTFSFDKPVGTDPRDFSWRNGYKPPTSVLENVSAEALSRETSFLQNIAPGTSLAEAQAFLKSQGLERASAQGDLLIYETRVFHDVDWRQRLVIEHKDGQVLRSIYLLDLDPSQNSSKSSAAYERVHGFLVKRFGNPVSDVHEGDFDKNFSSAVNSGQLTRVTDWNLEKGRLRLGIPSRFGQAARIEVHYAADIPDARDSHWGLDQV